MILTIYRNYRWSHENQRTSGLVNTASKLLTGITHGRLSSNRESWMRIKQTGFCPVKGCVGQVFTLWQISEHMHMFWRPTISAFLDFKVAFGSHDREILCHYLSPKGVSEKFTFSNFCVQTAEPEFVPTTMCHPSSPREVVFITVSPFQLSFSILSLRWLWRFPYPDVRILALIFTQTGIYLTWDMRVTLCYLVKARRSREFFSIVWTIM